MQSPSTPTETIQVRQTRYSRGDRISDILLWKLNGIARVLVVQQGLTFTSLVLTLDIVWMTWQEHWTISMDVKGDSGNSVLTAILSNDYISSSSSSSCRAGSTDIPDPLSPLLPIVHRPRQVLRTTSRILTQLLNVCSCWSSCFCTAMCGGL